MNGYQNKIREKLDTSSKTNVNKNGLRKITLPGCMSSNIPKVEYSKLIAYLQKIRHPDAHDIDFQQRYLTQLATNPHQCLPLRDAIHRSGNQQNLDPEYCTHTNLTPLQQTAEGKWIGDSIPSRFIIENDQYPRFLVSLVADWSRPQGGIIHSIQECVRSEDLIHVYLDLDSNSTPITTQDVNTIVETTLGVINQYFDTRHILTRPEVIILRNQGASQYKVHVHIPELTMIKKHLKYVVEKVKGILPLLAEFIDTNYSGCRMVLTKKKDNKNSIYYDPQYPPWGGARPRRAIAAITQDNGSSLERRATLNTKARVHSDVARDSYRKD